MKYLTLVANQSTSTDTVLAKIKPFIEINSSANLADNVVEIVCPQTTELTNEFRQLLYAEQIDFALQSEAVKKAEKRLLLSDMDETIVVGDTIDKIAQQFGVAEAVAVISQKSASGEFDYKQSLVERLQLIKGFPYSGFAKIFQQMQLADGAKVLLDGCNQRHITSCLISGGFMVFTEEVQKRIGFTKQIANELAFDIGDDGQEKIAGHCIGELIDPSAKLANLLKMSEELGLQPTQTIAIGDGANDIPMLQAAGLGIAYQGKSKVRQAVNAEIHAGPISNVLWFI